MPVYPFQCECGNEYSVVMLMSSDHVAECPLCGKENERCFQARRVIPNRYKKLPPNAPMRRVRKSAYTYECDDCGHYWELWQHMDEKHVADCPKCGAKDQYQNLARDPRAVSCVQWEGWYENLGDHPVYVKSKRDLHDQCEKRGLQACALL